MSALAAKVEEAVADLVRLATELEHERDALLAEKDALEREVEELRADLLEARSCRRASAKGTRG